MNFTSKSQDNKKGMRAVLPDPVDNTWVGFSLVNIFNIGAI
jgi:hypothetical protein